MLSRACVCALTLHEVSQSALASAGVFSLQYATPNAIPTHVGMFGLPSPSVHLAQSESLTQDSRKQVSARAVAAICL